MSEAVVSGTLAPDVSSDIRAAHSHLARRFLRNPLGIAALSVLTLIVLAAIFAPLLTSYAPNTASVLNVLQGPGAGHLLGTDGAGRDVWARLLYGARFTLAGALLRNFSFESCRSLSSISFLSCTFSFSTRAR